MNEKNVILNMKDREILYQLELDARVPFSKIAKKVKLSKPAVKYRVDRMIEKGIIEKFVLFVNGPKLGYVAYKFYIQLQNINSEKLGKIIDELKKYPEILWIATCDGKYDLILASVARNNVQAYDLQNELLTKYNQYIKEMLPLNYIDVIHQKRSYLLDQKREDLESPFWGDGPQDYQLDKYERKIISALCENARMPITEVAKIVGCSVDIVHNRIKKLVNDRIIQGSRLMMNKSLLGYEYYKVLLNVRFNSKEEERRFFSFLRYETSVIDIIRMMGKWNFELDIDVKNADEFHKVMMKLKNNFSKNIQDYESLLIFKEHKYNFFPMG